MTSPIKRTSPKNVTENADLEARSTDATSSDSTVEKDEKADALKAVKGSSDDRVVVKALKDGVLVAGRLLREGEEAVILRSKTLNRDGHSWLDMNQNDYFGEKRFEVK